MFDLGAQAAIEPCKDAAIHALMLDPLCAFVCTPTQIKAKTLEMFAAEKAYLPNNGQNCATSLQTACANPPKGALPSYGERGLPGDSRTPRHHRSTMKMSTLPAALFLLLGVLFTAACTPKYKEVKIPDAPEAAMRVIADQLGAANAGVLWTALPPTYRTDLTGLVREAGAKIDPDMYDGGFSTLGKLANVLETKRDFFLSSFMASQADKTEAQTNWGPGVAMLRTLVTSEVSTVNGLQTFELQEFLASTGSKMLKIAQQMSLNGGSASMVDQLRATTFTADTVTATTAMLRIVREGEEIRTEEYTKVEGRWVPSEMAAEWTQKVADAKIRLAKLTPEDMAKNKSQIMGAITMVNGVLDQLAAAESQEQFDSALQGAMMPIMGLMMMSQKLTSP